MADQRDHTRSSAQAAERPALEEAPTVLTRNPFHLNEKLSARAQEELKQQRESRPSPQSATAPGVAPHVDDRTHLSNRQPEGSGSSHSTANPLKMGMTLEGELLGHFQLEKFVGGGGMGAVFRALDTMLGRVVAVKVLSRERTDADTLRRFKNEAQSAARLDHKNIARVHYVGEDSGWNYIVFEFIEGINVRDMIEQVGPLDIDDALHFTMQIAEALDHAAQREVVHRDIKPSNIIITPKGRAKLVDMGLARLHQVESSNDDITASGVTLGTFDYISPEQARDPRAADVRSDIYSLGCTLYFMLCGRPPFPDGTVLQKLLSHNSDRPPDLQRFRPDVPDDIVDIVNRMLAKQPSQRYQTPAELMSELLLLAQKYQLTKVIAPAQLWTETRPAQPAWWERHLPWMAPLAILLLSVLALDFAMPTSQPNLTNMTPAAQAAPPPTPRAEADEPEGTAEPQVDTEQENQSPANPPARPSEEAGNVSPDLAASEPPAESTAATEATSPADNASDKPSSAKPGDDSESASPPLDPVAKGSTGSPPKSNRSANAVVKSTTSGQSTQSPATSTRPGVLVVTPDNLEDETAFTQLQEALRQAATSDSIHEVQLNFDGPLVVTTTLHIEALDLQLTAAAGKRPELVFQPDAEKLSRTAMIAFRGKSLSLAGIRLTMRAPEEISAEGWSMIYGGPLTELLEIRDSVLTFDNPQATALSDYGASFIRLDPLPVSRTQGSDMVSTSVADSTEISLHRCIARGEATFLRCEPGKALSIQWEQGLLATSGRMLDVENAIGTPSPSSMVRMALTNVTAVAELGLCRLGANSETVSHPLPLNLELNGCIIRTASEAPLVQQQGVDPTVHDADMLFILEQSATRFSRTRIRQNFAGTDRKELLKTDSMSWKSPVPASKPWHQHTSDDYIPLPSTGEQADSATTSAGFDQDRLPLLSPAVDMPIDDDQA